MAGIKKQNRLTKKEIEALFKQAVTKIIKDSPYTGTFIGISINDDFRTEITFYVRVYGCKKMPNSPNIDLDKNGEEWSIFIRSYSLNRGIQEIMGKLVLAVTDTSALEGAIMTEELEPATVNLLFP